MWKDKFSMRFSNLKRNYEDVELRILKDLKLYIFATCFAWKRMAVYY